ncbi:MAG: PTS sugar transporter subunit IIA [Spirochaetales bacterium]|nr:PTS sugar transporter subunit IIA [Spirochaetales bacterium]
MNIAELLSRGGVWYNVPGKTATDFLEALVSAIWIPAGVRKEELWQACARREASSPTAMGRGLAFPHPGSPMVETEDDAMVALAYPRFPVDWRAPDGVPVQAVFLILSASRNDHLTTLSALAKLCGQDDFFQALSREATLEELLASFPAL